MTCRGRCAKRHRDTVQCDTSNGQRGPRRKRNNQDFSGKPSTRTARDERLNDKASRERTASAAASTDARSLCGMNGERLRKKSTRCSPSFVGGSPVRTYRSKHRRRIAANGRAGGSARLGRPARGCDCAYRSAACRFGNSLTCAPPIPDPSQRTTCLLKQIR